MLAAARLAWRMQRWELLVIALAVAAAAGAMLWVSSEIVGLRSLRDECLATQPGLCDAFVGRAYARTQTAQLLLSVAELAPFVLGIVLGAPLVAREIDGRTAQLSWTMSRSRIRWLIGRVAFVVAVVVICLGVLAVTTEIVAALLDPERNLAQDFNFADSRGWILVARGFLVLAIGVLVGTVLGRVLPALLATILLSAAVFIGFAFVDGAILKAEATVVRIDPETGTGTLGDHWVESGLQLTDGTALTWDEVDKNGIRGRDVASQMAFTQDTSGCWYRSEADIAAGRPVGCEVAWVVSGERYPVVTARRGAMLGGLGLVALAGAAFVVQRRRPE